MNEPKWPNGMPVNPFGSLPTTNLGDQIRDYRARIAALEAENERLMDAIKWALRTVHEFEHPEGAPAAPWRAELRKRAALREEGK